MGLTWDLPHFPAKISPSYFDGRPTGSHRLDRTIGPFSTPGVLSSPKQLVPRALLMLMVSITPPHEAVC